MSIEYNKNKKINLILLAAGNSTRFNGNKLLSIINGKEMYLHTVENILNFKFNGITVVTQYEEIRKCMISHNIDVVMNHESIKGISHSIRLGIEHNTNCDAYMFLVCDQPYLRVESIEKFVTAFLTGDKGIACLGYNGRYGNPVIFAKEYEKELLCLTGDTGGKSILKKHLNDLVSVNVKNEIELLDIDTDWLIH